MLGIEIMTCLTKCSTCRSQWHFVKTEEVFGAVCLLFGSNQFARLGVMHGPVNGRVFAHKEAAYSCLVNRLSKFLKSEFIGLALLCLPEPSRCIEMRCDFMEIRDVWQTSPGRKKARGA